MNAISARPRTRLLALLAVLFSVSLSPAEEPDVPQGRQIGTLNGKPIYAAEKILGPQDLYVVKPDADADEVLKVWRGMMESIRSVRSQDVFVTYRSSSRAEHVDEVIEDLAKFDTPVYIGHGQIDFENECLRWDWWESKYDAAAFKEHGAWLASLARGERGLLDTREMTRTAFISTPEYRVDRHRAWVTVRLPNHKYADWPALLDIRLAGWVKPAQLRFPTSYPQWIDMVQGAYQPFAREQLADDLVRITWFRKAPGDVQQYDVRTRDGYALFGIRHSRGVLIKDKLYVRKKLTLDAAVIQDTVHRRSLPVRIVTKSEQGVEEFCIYWKSVNKPIAPDVFDQQALLIPGERLMFSPEYQEMLKLLAKPPATKE